jgi:hypothetical protein
VNDAQQRGEVGTIGNVFAVTVYDLTEQGDFLHALFGKRADFTDNVANRARTLDAAFVGDDAESTGVRTTIYDWHMHADSFALFSDG